MDFGLDCKKMPLSGEYWVRKMMLDIFCDMPYNRKALEVIFSLFICAS